VKQGVNAARTHIRIETLDFAFLCLCTHTLACVVNGSAPFPSQRFLATPQKLAVHSCPSWVWGRKGVVLHLHRHRYSFCRKERAHENVRVSKRDCVWWTHLRHRLCRFCVRRCFKGSECIDACLFGEVRSVWVHTFLFARCPSCYVQNLRYYMTGAMPLQDHCYHEKFILMILKPARSARYDIGFKISRPTSCRERKREKEQEVGIDTHTDLTSKRSSTQTFCQTASPVGPTTCVCQSQTQCGVTVC